MTASCSEPLTLGMCSARGSRIYMGGLRSQGGGAFCEPCWPLWASLPAKRSSFQIQRLLQLGCPQAPPTAEPAGV